MSILVTTRLPQESVDILENLAEEEHTDKASLIRKMLLSHMEEYLIQRAAELYRRGDASLEESAVLAHASVWKMMDYVRRNNIQPPEEPLEAFERSLEAARKLLGKKKK
jgi:predicted DNA-binding protein